MRIEIERRNKKFKEFLAEIEAQENIIRSAEKEIQRINREKDKHDNSCNHLYDDGASALKDSSYWVSDTYTYIDDWTGEEAEGDNGYTQYEKTCQICNKEIEY